MKTFLVKLMILVFVLPALSWADSSCALLRLYYEKPFDKENYATQIVSINNRTILSNYQYVLSEGKHQIKVREDIKNPNVLRFVPRRFRYREVTIDAKCGRVYNIRAKFNRQERKSFENYWDVEVVEER